MVNRAINPLVTTRPVYFSKKAALAKINLGSSKYSDKHSLVDGFVLSTNDEFSSLQSSKKKYPPPPIPEGWKSSRQSNPSNLNYKYQSTSDAAKASKLDPKARASILGESSLPGKSVFDFLSPTARNRIVAASGKQDLPPALGEVPHKYSMTEEERKNELQSQIPKVDKITAELALNRGTSGFMPYSDNFAKRDRYRAYLEHQSGISNELPSRDPNVSDKDWLQELREFANCAQIFKPISGSMATRFTSSTLSSQTSDSSKSTSLISKVTQKPEDPSEQAAKLSMYGPLTRSIKDWYPTRLLCKRFNVSPPAHVTTGTVEQNEKDKLRNTAPDLVSKVKLNAMMRESYPPQYESVSTNGSKSASETEQVKRDVVEKAIIVDTGTNDALEGEKAGEAVFRAIFGDDSDDE